MDWIVHDLWLIPALPLVAAGLSALVKQRQRRLAACLAIGSMVLALVLSCEAFVNALQHGGQGSAGRQWVNFFWCQCGDPLTSDSALRLGWVLDHKGWDYYFIYLVPFGVIGGVLMLSIAKRTSLKKGAAH